MRGSGYNTTQYLLTVSQISIPKVDIIQVKLIIKYIRASRKYWNDELYFLIIVNYYTISIES